MGLSDAELERYSRHLRLEEVGPAGQRALGAARVLVVGAGGLGSPAALYLAAAGVGRLGLIDGDRVELSNLQRQVLFATADVGQPKAVAGAARLRALNPAIRVIAHFAELDSGNVVTILGDYDVIVDGTDRVATRYLVNDACVILGKPLVSAAVHRFEGQALTYLPGRGACYRCLFPEPPETPVASCAEAGVLGVLPGVLGVIQATEALKIVLGQGAPLAGRLLTYDALEMRFAEFPVARRLDCAVCGVAPGITTARSTPPSDAAASPPLRRLSAHALAALLASAPAQDARPRLVDVREPAEFAAGHLPGAESIPLAELDAMNWKAACPATTVFMCRSGARSLRACAIAARGGLADPAHLEGGLLAWAAAIDPSFTVA